MESICQCIIADIQGDHKSACLAECMSACLVPQLSNFKQALLSSSQALTTEFLLPWYNPVWLTGRKALTTELLLPWHNPVWLTGLKLLWPWSLWTPSLSAVHFESTFNQYTFLCQCLMFICNSFCPDMTCHFDWPLQNHLLSYILWLESHSGMLQMQKLRSPLLTTQSLEMFTL